MRVYRKGVLRQLEIDITVALRASSFQGELDDGRVRVKVASEFHIQSRTVRIHR